MTIGAALMTAAEQQQTGNLEAAHRLCQQILAHVPGQPQALTMLGSIAYQQGDDDAGDQLVERAITALTHDLEPMSLAAPEQAGLANLLLARRRPKEAYERLAKVVLPLNPIRSTPEAFKALCDQARAANRPSILMTAMPKSASESLGHALATGLGLGQSHVSIGLFPRCCLVPCRLRVLASGGMMAKEHIGPDEPNIKMLAEAGIDRVLVHLRDPRQALLSWVHFVRDDVSRRMLAPIWREIVPPARVLDRGIQHVIDWCLEYYLPLLIDFALRWSKREKDGDTRLNVRCLTFETFIADKERYLAEALGFYGLDPGDLAGDDQQTTIHFRQGRIDEWREVFTDDQSRHADKALPALLADRFGWTV